MLTRESLALVALCLRPAITGSGANTATVIQVLDGDTFRLHDARDVRCLGIDAPEKGDPLAEEATAALNRLVSNREVGLETASREKDDHGRLLAYVFVGEMLVNEEMVRQGWAHVRRPISAKYRSRLRAAQAEARAAGRGIWSGVRNIFLAITRVNAKPSGGQTALNEEYIAPSRRRPFSTISPKSFANCGQNPAHSACIIHLPAIDTAKQS